ncbi:MAG: HlyD family secretion protein [Bacteroidales bacterium]|nr:HlyD family secretion protein [Bacteroidales bacterium]
MKDRKPEILYSDPVKEIISNPPRKIIRWGTTIIFSVFVLFILFAWIIRYPDIVPAVVEITTVNPPVTMSTKITGRINNLYVKDGEKVTSGKLLAIMETTASIKDINLLKDIIDTIDIYKDVPTNSLPAFSDLGELQPSYASFIKNLSDYNTYIRNDNYGSKINSAIAEIREIQEYINKISYQEKLYRENHLIEEKKYKRDSSLFSSNVYSESDIEKSRQELININIELQQVRLDRSEKTLELAEKNQQLQDYRITRQEEKEKLQSILNESFLNLKAQLKIWENNYLLVSPVDGTVTFTRFWSKNQSVVKDEPVLNIVPINAGDFVGRINLKMQRSGKVKTGQMVNIKLSGYPYLEYGIIRGIVKSKSMVPAGDAYIIEITLPQGLTSLYGKKLEFTQNMQGTAEIITEDLRLLQKIFNPFRYLISKNKR